MATEKLHLNNSWIMQFDAVISSLDQYQGNPSLVLDKSAFYGESGGQLGDRGTIRVGGQSLTVVDTQIDESGNHQHILDATPTGISPGDQAEGLIDQSHRRDMMSQHSGQHLLSAVCWQALQAKTISARLGSTESTIDIGMETINTTQVRLLEDLVNGLIMEARPMRIHYPEPDQLEAMNLRRTPKVVDNIRVIEIEDYDFTPCGGTHCENTGQIGPLMITSTERYKGGVRLHFLAGMRTIDHLRTQTNRLDSLGESLGCGNAGVEESAAKLQNELRQRSQEAGELRATLAGMLADQMLADHPALEGRATPIILVREEDDLATLRTLAERLVKRSDVAALVAGKDPKSGDWRLVVMAGIDSGFDAGGWFRGPGKEAGARGGGRPERAEGRLSADVDPKSLQLV